MAKRKNTTDDGGGTPRVYKYWDSKHDVPFMQCLLELTDKGQIIDCTCKHGVFKELEHMMEKLVPGCGVKSKPTIRTKMKKLKHWYHSTVMMRNQSGFGWDQVNNCVAADPDVWENFLKGHKDCKAYKGIPFPQFFDLAPVFGKGRATGDMGFSGHDPNISEFGGSSSEDDDSPAIPLPQMNNPSTDQEMFNIINDGVEATFTTNQKRPPSGKGHVQSKRKKKEQFENHIVEMGVEMKGMKPVVKDSVDTIAKALGDCEEYDNMRRDLLKHLEKLEGLSRAERILAVRRFSNNPVNLKCFYELEDEEDRLTLVFDVLGK